MTRPGGVVVCCNFDGFAITHYPEDELLQRHILTVFPRLVDVNIGRKTAPIFHECGLINISVLFEPDFRSQQSAPSIPSVARIGSCSWRQRGLT